MIILHGTWLPTENQFAIWGEDTSEAGTQRRGKRGAITAHPFAAYTAQLQEIAERYMGRDTFRRAYESPVLLIPGSGRQVLPSPRAEAAGIRPPLDTLELLAWSVDAIFPHNATISHFLYALPANGEDHFIPGGDWLFWRRVMAVMLDYIQMGRVIPGMHHRNEKDLFAYWEVRVEKPDIFALEAAMPAICRAGAGKGKNIKGQLPPAREVLEDFILYAGDAFMRHMGHNTSRFDWYSDRWLYALTGHNARISSEPRGLYQSWQIWHEKLEAESGFRLCLRLDEPADGGLWHLHALLQSSADPGILIDAAEIWDAGSTGARHVQQQTGQNPQEVLLAWMGRAAHYSEAIEQGLYQERQPVRFPMTAQEAYQFLSDAARDLEDEGVIVLVPDWWARRDKLRARAEIRPFDEALGFLGSDKLFEYKWQVALGDTTFEREDFEELVALKQPLVAYKGRWIALDPKQIEAARAFFEKQPDDGEVGLLDALRIEAGLVEAQKEAPEGIEVEAPAIEAQVADILKRMRNPERTKIVYIPKRMGLEADLRPYQKKGLSWLVQMREMGLGACLADDMGLGKTIQAIALWLYERHKLDVSGSALVVCPTSVLGNWAHEIKRFAPALTVMKHHGPDRLQNGAFADAAGGVDVVLTSYPLLSRDSETLQSVKWASVTLDEAQNIKNPSTKQAQAARALKAEHRLALTGTPIENRLRELWSIFQFLNPGYLGSRRAFTRSFATPIEKHNDEEAAQTLRKLIAPFILRRVKTDPKVIKDLPDKFENKVYCTLTVEQATLYEAIVRAEMEAVENAESEMSRRGAVLRMLVRLKQICNHPEQFLKEGGRLRGRSGKLDRLMEMLEEIRENGERALVFTQYAQMGRLLDQHITETLGEEILYLHGGTPSVERAAMIDRFQQEDGPLVFVLSLRAGGTGLNLTAATQVFHYDRWYNPAVEEQATDRAHRIGQTDIVEVHKFICLGTLEERIDELIERKKGIADQIIGGGESWLTELDSRELNELVMLREEALGD